MVSGHGHAPDPRPQLAPLRRRALPHRGRAQPHLRRHADRQPGPRQPLRLRGLRGRLDGGASRGRPHADPSPLSRPARRALCRGRAGGRDRADSVAAALQAPRGVPAADHVRAAAHPRGPRAPDLGSVPADRELALRGHGEPQHRRVHLPGLQSGRHRRRRSRRGGSLGLHLPHPVRCRPAGHVAEHAHGPGHGGQRQPRLCPGLHAGLLHGRSGRGHCRPAAGRRARHGSGRADPGLRRGGHRRAREPRGRADRSPAGGCGPRARDNPVPGGRAGGALSDGDCGVAHPTRRALRPRMSPAPAAGRRLLVAAGPIVLALVILPYIVEPYQTVLFSYGLIFAIAALGFNLLLGYTGLLSFGHSAYFGMGAYAVAFVVKYLRVTSMELFLLAGILASALVTALFGFVCVRYTRIYFSILTLALSQVLWSLAFKFFWVTGGTDGLRVPTPTLLGVSIGAGQDKMTFLAHRYYYYVLVIFLVAVALMWVIVHSPFGKALQAIRDNEIRAEFVGVQVWHYRWVAFLISGVFTGLAGALWVPLNGLTTPDILHWSFSGEIVFFTVLGGFSTFAGPIVGAVVFNYLKTFAVGYTVYWQMFLGVVLVTLVMALPTGIMGMAARLGQKWRRAPAP